MDKSKSLFLQTLAGEKTHRPPVWLMRQAGRYLPEYREVRARSKNFLDFCYTPSMAAEVTLQPIRRYDFDASIVFADILLICDAMDRNVAFVAGEGPTMTPLEKASDLDNVPLETVAQRLSPVFETVERVRAGLPETTPLIGFAGSPWTVTTYLIEGRGGTDKSQPRLWAYTRPDELDAVIDRLTVATVRYLDDQVKAGADALMLFDSWAEGLPDHLFDRLVIKPTKRIVEGLRALGVDVPIIGFARGAGGNHVAYAKNAGLTAIGLDTSVPIAWADKALPPAFPVQGNLDPLLMVAGGEPMRTRAREIVAGFSNRPHIFNLGHGITPQASPDHVTELLKTLREGEG